MRQDRDLKPVSHRDGRLRADLSHSTPALAHLEEMTALAHQARRDAEHFINSNIDDPTQGWPLK